MADFFQNGLICTLQKLGERPLAEMEDELRTHGERQRVALLLPALYSEFEKDSMAQIIDELKGADYLYRIVLSLDRATEEQFRHVRDILSVLPVDVKIVWNDGPRIQGVLERLQESDFTVAQQGKGRGVWLAMGYALTDKQVYTLALHDCDIIDYRREMLARLLYPVVHPATDFEFSKGFYARYNAKLYGRVTRLFFTPLVRSLMQLQLTGARRFLAFMDSFRYPLAGEFAFIRSLAKGIRISPTWGLEVSQLAEVFNNTTVDRVCQVEIADSYKHKHQKLSKDDASRGLTRMAADIAQVFLRVLAQGGVVLSHAHFNTLLATYSQQSRLAIEKYHALALLNGLAYDRHQEIEAVEAFTKALRLAQRGFSEDPFGAPLMSAWVRVRAGIPDLAPRLKQAIEEDNA